MSKFLQLGFFVFLVLFFLPLAHIGFTFEDYLNDKTSLTIFVSDQGIDYQVFCKETQNIEECFLENQIEIEKGDIISPSLETQVHQGMIVHIKRAKLIYLDYFGKKSEVYTHKDQVEDFLEEQNIKLSKEDSINVDLKDYLYYGMSINIKKNPPPKPKIISSQIGFASWYSFIPGDFAASRFFKKGTKLLVTNLSNQKQVIVTINDFGPQPWTGRILDLEKNAFAKLAPLSLGVIKVKIQKL